MSSFQPKAIKKKSFTNVWLGIASVFGGVVIFLMGIDSLFNAVSQFSSIGGQFLGGFLATTPSTDYDYSVFVLLSIIAIAVGWILILVGALVFDNGI